MNKKLKIILIVLGIVLLMSLIFFTIDYLRVKKQDLNEYEELLNNSNNTNAFVANIKEISTYNEITTVLIEGLESNDINYRGKFEFTVDNDTELLWKEQKIELSDLKEGQIISITATGEILEKYPAKLTKVTKVIVLDDKL